MLRHIVVVFLAVFLLSSVESIAKPPRQDEFKDTLARAEALYYDAKFVESIELLLRLESSLEAGADRLPERISVKLELALAHIGLNDNAEAKSLLRELYALDADYRLDSVQFSPKVVALAAEAKADDTENRCQKVRADAQKFLETENAAALLQLIASKKASCSGLDSLGPHAAELFYKTGVDLYKRGELGDALRQFQSALEVSPNNALASDYIDLIQGKMQVSLDRLSLQWQKDFAGHELALASSHYLQLVSLGSGADTKPILNQARAQYRTAVSALVESWKQACTTGDQTKMDLVRSQASEMLPEPTIAEDMLAQMTTCTIKTPEAAQPVSQPGCLEMTSQVAMARIKTRVNPDFPVGFKDAFGRIPLNIRAQIRVDEKGNVSVLDVQGSNAIANEAIRSAVGRWKFIPASDQNGPRCVSTEIPITLKPNTP